MKFNYEAYEEINNGRLVAAPHNLEIEEEKPIEEKEVDKLIKELPKEEISEKKKEKKEKEVKKEKEEKEDKEEKEEKGNKREKKYIQPPIIAHDSQLPSMAFEVEWLKGAKDELDAELTYVLLDSCLAFMTPFMVIRVKR